MERQSSLYLLTDFYKLLPTNSQKQSLPQNLQLEKANLNISISVSESVFPHPLCGRIPIIQPAYTFFLYTQALNFCSIELHEARAGSCRSQHNSDPSVHILWLLSCMYFQRNIQANLGNVSTETRRGEEETKLTPLKTLVETLVCLTD